MPPSQNKTNFKTYDASTRLLAAVIGSIKGKARLDFHELASLMGGGTTASAVDHRLRPLKHLAELQAQWREDGKDPGELPVERGEIQKFYGESTVAGLEYHFRGIKALSRAQEAAIEQGEDPAALTATPAARGKAPAAGTPASTGNGNGKRKRGAAAAPAGGANKKKKAAMSEEDTNDTGFKSDYDAKDAHSDDDASQLPTPTPKRRGLPAKAQPNGKGKAATSPTTSAETKKRGAAASDAKPKANGDRVARSLFGNDIHTTNLDDSEDDDIKVLDMSKDIPPPTPARRGPGRPARVKKEPEPEDEIRVSHASVFDDDDWLDDGEV
ncbi:uncharacterized protein F4822DRAFT_427067 [Hypoxylon trugodes]|uniref:uncharacterized protein n=1 Tax=Hypoxylon trugodes TaxID=326681 RepID=UPI00219ECFAF|nr:uncharacterized protein F4822DRAFT_427067 [Hypoxylon trugodes]KAI1391217.1 hypothetical protein F4822DRAFT_427067 [Hypoxylon trugodes]